MPTYEEVLAMARSLPLPERERLVRDLAPPAALTPLGTLAARPPAPHSAAWVKSERGHAVLATDTGPAEAEIPPGPDAVAGMWRDLTGVAP
jgi:hypothetical protein